MNALINRIEAKDARLSCFLFFSDIYCLHKLRIFLMRMNTGICQNILVYIALSHTKSQEKSLNRQKIIEKLGYRHFYTYQAAHICATNYSVFSLTLKFSQKSIRANHIYAHVLLISSPY